MNRMVFANIKSRPVRSLVSVVAVAIEVALILLLVGLTNGMVNDTRHRMEGVGADIVVRSSSSSSFMSMAGNTLPIKMADLLQRQPGVKAVAPVAIQMNNSSIDTVDGIDLNSFDAVSGGFQFLHGAAFNAPFDVIVDDLYASAKHVRVGQRIKLLGHQFTVSGIFVHGKGSRIYIPLSTLDQLAGSPGKVAVIWVKLDNPDQTDAIVAHFQQLLPGYNVQPMREYLSLFTAAKMPGLPAFQAVMIGVGVTIGFLVIFLSMYTTILERTREIGILKALGAGKGFIISSILQESAFMAVVGIVAGVIFTWIVRALLHRAIATLPIELTTPWILRSALIALLGSAVGALYPSLRAAAQDPIAALAYE